MYISIQFCVSPVFINYAYVYFYSISYTIILNGADSIREAFLKNSTHFADRGELVANPSFNPERKGLTYTLRKLYSYEKLTY